MVFPVVIYGCESWTMKKAEHQRTDAFRLWCWRTLESPSDCRKIKAVNSKGNQSWIFFGKTEAEAEVPVLWPLDAKSQLIGKKKKKRTQILGKIEGKRRKEQQRMRWLDSITYSMNINLSKFLERMEDRRAWHTTFPGVVKNWTQLRDWGKVRYKNSG